MESMSEGEHYTEEERGWDFGAFSTRILKIPGSFRRTFMLYFPHERQERGMR